MNHVSLLVCCGLVGVPADSGCHVPPLAKKQTRRAPEGSAIPPSFCTFAQIFGFYGVLAELRQLATTASAF